MFYMVCYDIQDDRRRTRIRKVLEGYGERVQFSVFECDLSEAQYKGLRVKLCAEMKNDEDSVRWYPLCKGCAGDVEFMGDGVINENEHYFIM